MFKNTKLALVGCAAWLALSGSAHAEHFDFDPGMGSDVFSPDLAAGDGKPYEWYYQGINLDFEGSEVDGREDATYNDSPYGNIPYITFDGTDKSQVGHCLQIVFGPANAVSRFQNSAQLRFSFVDSSGVDREILNIYTRDSNPYNVVRMWIQNTGPSGSSLYWHTKIADLDGPSGAWNQSATMNIWRLEKDEAGCLAAANGTPVGYVTIKGVTGNYTVCEKNNGCFPGG